MKSNSQNGFTLWFTGLSGSGKTTLSKILEKKLKDMGYKVEILDGDIIRKNLSQDLGFSKLDRERNILRVGFVCSLLSRNGVVAIAALISPYREARNMVRAEHQRFIEIYMECPIEVLEKRDVKGLYAKAKKGEIANFTGISDPYEEPLTPDITISSVNEPPEKSAERILQYLQAKGYIPGKGGGGEGYSPDEEEAVKKRLEDLGYM